MLVPAAKPSFVVVVGSGTASDAVVAEGLVHVHEGQAGGEERHRVADRQSGASAKGGDLIPAALHAVVSAAVVDVVALVERLLQL